MYLQRTQEIACISVSGMYKQRTVFGVEYRPTGSSEVRRYREYNAYQGYWAEFTSITRFEIEKIIVEKDLPEEADEYRNIILNFDIVGEMGETVCVCIPKETQIDIDQAFELDPVATIYAGEGALQIELTNEEIEQINEYGIIFRPIRRAEEEPGTYIEKATKIAKENIKLSYEHQNMAKTGVVSDITPGQYSVVIAENPITMEWTYTQKYSAPQEYVGIRAINEGTGEIKTICKKQTIRTESGERAAFSIPPETLEAGVYKMEVSAMPSAASEYYTDDDPVWYTGANVTYVAKNVPGTSSVTCDGMPVPTVQWVGTAQAAFQVRFGEYDSGAMAGEETSFRVPKIFVDGTYPVSVRTATEAGEWSEWTEETYVEIKNTPVQGAIDLHAENLSGNVRLEWSGDVDVDNYAVYRNSELIGVTSGNTFADRYANGKNSYHIKGVKAGNYVKSNTVVYEVKFAYDVISADEGYTYLPLPYTNTPQKSQAEDNVKAVVYAHYSGREKPIAVTSEQKTRVREFVYGFKGKDDVEAIKKLVGETVMWKGKKGGMIYGILNDIRVYDERFPAAEFRITEIHRDGEMVEYAV